MTFNPEYDQFHPTESFSETSDRKALINDLNRDDHRNVAGDANRTAHNQQLERNGTLPATRLADNHSVVDILSSSRASAEDKLKAVEQLARQGVESITLKDKNGHEHRCRIELERSGEK